MKQKNAVLKLSISGVLCAVAVMGSFLSFPVLGSKCAPIQHMVNVLCAVLLGPWYAVGTAFSTSLLRNLLGLGSFMAFPGSIFGALLAGLLYAKSQKTIFALVGEMFGTGIIGGSVAYPVSILLMGNAAGSIAFYAYVIPFLISTVAGALLAGMIVLTLEKQNVLSRIKSKM